MKKIMVTKEKRNGRLLLPALLVAALLSGCGASSTQTSSNAVLGGRHDSYAAAEVMDVEEEAAYEEYEYDTADLYLASESGASPAEATESAGTDAGGSEAGGSDAEEVKQDSSRKLITTVNLSAETEDFDAFNATIERKTESLGGYVESANVYNARSYYTASDTNRQRNADYTIRIPAKRLNEFLSEVQEISNILDRSRYVEDVTLTYVDIESRKKALVTERDRLLELVEQAETVEDIIALEERIATVRYEIESIESRLRTFDNRIDYSTVYLNVQEVVRYTPKEEAGAMTRMKEGFVNSLYSVGNGIKEFFVTVVIHLPQIIIFLLVVLVLVVVVKKLIKFFSDDAARQERKAKRAAKKEAKKAAKNTGKQQEK